jgi:hypothetical protein
LRDETHNLSIEQNRNYGYKALKSDTIPLIPEHFKAGSQMNRFGLGGAENS